MYKKEVTTDKGI